MKAGVQVISKEIIKPSSPTPTHLRQHQFSFLDQINPPVYTAVLIFFEFDPKLTEISKILKASLSEVLSLFYPLAGRASKSDNYLSIECNDEGVPFVEARVKNCKLSDVVDNPIPAELNKLLAFQSDIANEFFLGVQLSTFKCGGFAISTSMSHKVSDGLSKLVFNKTWAAVTRRALGDHQAKIETPQFVAATLFPPKLQSSAHYDSQTGINPNMVTKRFVFKPSNIEHLRAKYQSDKIRPSRVETLSAFIWSRFVALTKDIPGAAGNKKVYDVLHTVNLRPKFDPPLPQNCFGNIYRISMVEPKLDTGEECYGMVRQVREGISKMDNEYVKELKHGDAHLKFMEDYARKFAKGERVVFNFTSLCNFPLYDDNDFGWGKPTWAGIAALPFKNLVIFFDAKDGDGIEAYVSLEEEVMEKIECDSEFLKHLGNGCVGNSDPSTTRHQSALQFSRL